MVRLLTVETALVLVHTACSSDGKAPTPAPADAIEIGSLVAQTGDLAGTGKDNTDSANLAVEQINAAGGVLGRPLRLVVDDDHTTTDGARTGYTALINRKVAAVIGPSSSAQVADIADLISASHTVTFGRTSTSPLLTTLADGDFFFRVAPSDVYQARVLATIVRESGVERLCVVHRDDTYGTKLADAVATEIGAAPLIMKVPYNPATKDLSGVLDGCAPLRCTGDAGAGTCSDDAKIGVLMITFVSDGAAILVNRPEWSATKQKFFFTDGARDTEVLKLGLPAERLEGARGTIPSGPDPESAEGVVLAAYRSAYQARYGIEAPPFSQNAFEAAYVIASAIELAGTTDGFAVRDAIRRTSSPGGTTVSAGKWAEIKDAIAKKTPIDYRGVTGDAAFDENGDLKPPYYYRVWRIQNGISITDRIEKVGQ